MLVRLVRGIAGQALQNEMAAICEGIAPGFMHFGFQFRPLRRRQGCRQKFNSEETSVEQTIGQFAENRVGMLGPLLHCAQYIGVVQACKRREDGGILLKILHRRTLL